MTIEECEKRNKAVVRAWKEWKEGKNYLENLDCAILAEIFSIKYLLACQRYLICTDNPNDARTTAPNKKTLETIFNFLQKLSKITEIPKEYQDFSEEKLNTEQNFETIKAAACSYYLNAAEQAKAKGLDRLYDYYTELAKQTKDFKPENISNNSQTRKTPCLFHFATSKKKTEQPEHLKVDIANKELAFGQDFTDCGEPTIVSRKALNEIADGYKWFGYKELTGDNQV